MNEAQSELRRMSDVDDLEIAPGEPDVRGWDVVLGDREVGDVDDLVVDRTAMKVRYLIVDLDKSALDLSDDRRVLVPVGQAQIDENEKQVRLAGFAQQMLIGLPDASGSDWGATATAWQEKDRSATTKPRAEQAAAFARETDTADVNRSRERETTGNRLTRSAEELKIGKREVQAGEVRVGKHVETEHVTQQVSRERDRVRIERRPVSGEMRADATISESGEIRVPVVEEEVTVEKRPVVKEELVISKERVSETEPVEADLRREEFDIEKSGRVNVSGERDVRDRGER